MGKLKQFFEAFGGRLIGEIGNILDEVVTSEDEKLKLKNQLSAKVLDSLMSVLFLQTQIILAEASGNWLQRSWRPIVMLLLTFIVIYNHFLAPCFGLPFTELQIGFWDLLQLGIGGYVVGRSIEKVSKSVTENIDLSLLKKKDRKHEIR